MTADPAGIDVRNLSTAVDLPTPARLLGTEVAQWLPILRSSTCRPTRPVRRRDPAMRQGLAVRRAADR